MDERQLQERIQTFIRQFGLLDQEHTPCGRPLPTSQAHALQILGDGGVATQRNLARRLNLDESTVSRLVDQLVARGWVDRTVDGHNRRQACLIVTAEGWTALDEIQQASRAKFRQIQERIPPDQRDQVLAALDLLLAAIGKDKTPHANPADLRINPT